MEKNGVGAKPKTGTGTAVSNGRHGTSESSGTQPDSNSSRANRTETSPTRQSQGSYARTFRNTRSSNNNNSNATNNIDSNLATNDNITRRGSVPNSVARNRLSNTRSTSNSQRPSLSEYSPLGRHGGSNGAAQNRGRGPFSRPALAHNNTNSKTKNSDDSSKNAKKTVPLSPVSTETSSSHSNVSTDSEVQGDSTPDPQPLSSSGVQETGDDDSVTLGHSTRSGSARPMSTSRDAALARQLLQDDMQAMMSADEELARQLQEELNGVPSPPNVLFNPLRPLGFRESREDSPETSSPEAHSPPPFPMPMPRGRHYPGRPMFARGEEMRRRRGRLGGGMQVLMRAPGQGAVGLARAGGGEGGAGMRLLMGGLRRRGQRPTDSPDDDGANLPQGEFDPDERLLAGGHPEDFLSIMHDPSLMLLMLLLRAPDTLNEGGVDLEDYEGLWELAERLGEVRRRGITEEEINQLPTHKFKSESAKVEFGAAAAEANAVQCQICLVDFEVGDSLRSIPCKHDFHKGCIDEWLKHYLCPCAEFDLSGSALDVFHTNQSQNDCSFRQSGHTV